MKLCKLIAAMIFITCFLLAGCDSGDKKRYSWGARNLDQANALFIRIQASYEVIKTGEIVEFDYIMSCYNAEVRGSFRGVEHPSTMYKMTKDRAVLSVTHPNHYCINGGFSKSQSSQKYFGLITHPRNLYRVPILGWYDNVDDLRVGYYYLTNDAYSSPRAKVRFIDYKASKSTREDYKAWVAKTEDEYVQVGALPGPFGCGHGSLPKDGCYSEDRKARNHGGRVASSHARVSVRTLRVPEVLDEFPAYMRAYFPADRRAYFCEYDSNPVTAEDQRWTISHIVNKKVKAFIDAHPDQDKPRSERYKDWKYKQVVSLRKKITTMRKGKIRLDPDALKGKGEPELPIEEVYPTLGYKNPNPATTHRGSGIFQILYDPTWRGFEIVGPYRSDRSKEPRYYGRFTVVLFVNDELACEAGKKYARSQGWTLFDSKRGLIFNTKGSKG